MKLFFYCQITGEGGPFLECYIVGGFKQCDSTLQDSCLIMKSLGNSKLNLVTLMIEFLLSIVVHIYFHKQDYDDGKQQSGNQQAPGRVTFLKQGPD